MHEPPMHESPRGAVVTGGGRGIGAAVARTLAESGFRVVVAARTAGAVEAVAESLREAGHDAWAATCDVTDGRSVNDLAEAARRHLSHVDALVNNAGTATSAPLARVTLDEWNRVMAVNATGTFLCTRAFLPGMVARGWGRVVNVASVAGLTGARYISAYAASKHAVVGFTRATAAEVAGTGVTVNAVCPGYVDTPMTEQSIQRIVEKTGKSRDEAVAAMLAVTRQPRLISADEVAQAVCALCGEAAGAINGQTVVLDGGGLLA